MIKILFVYDDHLVIPMIAAAFVRKKHSEKAVAFVAVNGSISQETVEFLQLHGIQDSNAVIPLDKTHFSMFDLVICFSQESFPCLVNLPGNPPTINWRLDISAPAEISNLEVDALIPRIHQLVDDLFEQGYCYALTNARAISERVLDNLQEGILAHDRHRRIFFFNKAAEKITGYRKADIIGKDCHEVFPGGFCRSQCSFCNPADISHLPEKPYILYFKRAGGELRHLEMSLVNITEDQHDLSGVVASFRDISMPHAFSDGQEEAIHFNGIVGLHSRILDVRRNILELAQTSVPVLIQGESGTGKELAAAAIHTLGARKDKLFVPVNCGALPENLLETELFGHVRGAFSGAVRDKKGRFELADGGTIFLDEIGDISAAMQVKLLRVLQDGTFQRVGGEETITVDVRVISATHKNLRTEISQGRFREDLFYRLCVIPFVMPALRDRKSDIPLLVEYFLRVFGADENRESVILTPETMDILSRHDWPGNVRELQNVIRYILVRCREDLVKPHHLPENILKGYTLSMESKKTGWQPILTLEKISQALVQSKGNRVQAARLLGIGRATLYRYLNRYEISK